MLCLEVEAIASFACYAENICFPKQSFGKQSSAKQSKALLSVGIISPHGANYWCEDEGLWPPPRGQKAWLIKDYYVVLRTRIGRAYP